MAMTNLEKLKHFMAPYYQEVADETLLEEYITDYTYPECAASVLWYELSGKTGLQMDGLQKMDTGAEKFVYSEPGTMQLACNKQGDYYAIRCDMKTGSGSSAIKVSKSTVGNISEDYGSSNE